ncbi:hypothetical protein [Spirochaeta dissipatitropha]
MIGNKKNGRNPAAVIIILILSAFPGIAQEQIEGFAGIRIGMIYEDVDAQLQRAGVFNYRGQADVSFSPGRDRIILEAAGIDYLQRGIFQFQDSVLFSITLFVNPSKMDHFTLLSRFTELYGEPASFSPQRIRWQSNNVRLSLERPLTVQYLDMQVFEALQEAGKAEESRAQLSRDLFLDLF